MIYLTAAGEGGQTPAQFQTRTAENVGVWPPWQSQHHGQSPGEPHVQQQPNQPEVFPVSHVCLYDSCTTFLVNFS